jgi:hypothetical protein
VTRTWPVAASVTGSTVICGAPKIPRSPSDLSLLHSTELHTVVDEPFGRFDGTLLVTAAL